MKLINKSIEDGTTSYTGCLVPFVVIIIACLFLVLTVLSIAGVVLALKFLLTVISI